MQFCIYLCKSKKMLKNNCLFKEKIFFCLDKRKLFGIIFRKK